MLEYVDNYSEDLLAPFKNFCVFLDDQIVNNLPQPLKEKLLNIQ